MTYAKGTKTSISTTEAEIKKMLRRYGAENFAIAEGQGKAQVLFEVNDLRIIIRMPLPPRDAPEFVKAARTLASRRRKSIESVADEPWEQACRAKWRALLLCIRAKIEGVASGVETIEQAFAAHIVLPSGQTIDEWRQQHAGQLSAGKMPPLLGGPQS